MQSLSPSVELTATQYHLFAVAKALSRFASHPDSYVLISPCRDEAAYCRRTLDSVIAQTIKPDLWVIIDDGSTDSTPSILREYADRHPWICVLTRPNRGKRKLGGGVIDAFYAGYDAIDQVAGIDSFSYLCKLDLDLDLPSTYFETLINLMRKDRRLGTVSGKPYFSHHGKLQPELCGDENSVGMTKFYRTSCFTSIGGFVRELMWDGIDCHRCRQKGWKAASIDADGLRFLHLRPMGTSDRSWWRGRVRHGYGQYFMGTSPAYILASAAYRITHPPLVLGSLAMLRGYFGAMLTGVPRYGDAEFRQFLRRYQWECLLHGKQRATKNAELDRSPQPAMA